MRSRALLVCLVAALAWLPSSGSADTTITGEKLGAFFQITVPDNWNGDLVINNHGFDFAPPAPNPGLGPLATLMLAEGYAIAASSYSNCCWTLFSTQQDLNRLVGVFEANFGPPNNVILHGFSLGGIVTAQGVEKLGWNVVGAYPACGALVRTVRALGWTVPIANVSFVGAEAMLRLLVQHGQATGRDYTRALVNSQVVPSYEDVALPGVAEYRSLMDRYAPAVPPALRDDRYVSQRYSVISLEGYVNARVVVEAVRRAGPQPTRGTLRQALESIKGLDLGIGAALSFGPERHQGLDSVYFMRVDGEQWVPITDWASAVQA